MGYTYENFDKILVPGTAIGATVVIAEFFFFRWMMNPITPPAELNGLIWGWKLKKFKKTVWVLDNFKVAVQSEKRI